MPKAKLDGPLRMVIEQRKGRSYRGDGAEYGVPFGSKASSVYVLFKHGVCKDMVSVHIKLWILGEGD